MKITIISDASWCPTTRICGYGYYIGSGRIKEQGLAGYGVMRDICETAQLAEAKTVVNAITIGLNSKLIQNNDCIIIRIDCQPVIKLFQKCILKEKQPNETKIEIPATQMIRLINQHELAISFIHVKGHQVGDLSGAELSNQICDLQAKFAMRLARKEYIKSQEIKNFNGQMLRGSLENNELINKLRRDRQNYNSIKNELNGGW